jgi:hypothetical protein
MINLYCLSSVRIVLTLVAMICDMSFLHMFNLVAQFLMIFILVLIWKLPKISTVVLLSPFHNTSCFDFVRHISFIIYLDIYI